MSPVRPAARLLDIESRLLPPILAAAPADAFDLPSVCTGWSVRDVLAHCGAALTRIVDDDLHRFTPEDNEGDVAARRSWPVADVIAELVRGYEQAAAAIHVAGGRLDAFGIGEWMHGGDVREPLGEPDPYTSEGVDLALELLSDRSRAMDKAAIDVHVDGRSLAFGVGQPSGRVDTDTETFIRMCGGRRPDPVRYQLDGVTASALVLFG